MASCIYEPSACEQVKKNAKKVKVKVKVKMDGRFDKERGGGGGLTDGYQDVWLPSSNFLWSGFDDVMHVIVGNSLVLVQSVVQLPFVYIFLLESGTYEMLWFSHGLLDLKERQVMKQSQVLINLVTIVITNNNNTNTCN